MKRTVAYYWHERRACVVLYALLAVTLFLFWFATGLQNDDYDHLACGTMYGDGFWDSLSTIVRRRFYTDNIRLSTFFIRGAVIWPKILMDFVFTICALAMFHLATRLVNRRLESFQCVLLIFAMMVMLPWYDSLKVSSFASSYILTGAIGLWAVELFLGRRRVLPVVVAFFAAWLHEGFGVPFICGAVLWMMFGRRRCTPTRIAAVAVMVLVTVVMLIGMRDRMLYNHMSIGNPLVQYAGYLIIFMSPFVALLLLTAWFAFTKQLRPLLTSGPWPLLAGAALAGCAIFFKAPVARAAWFQSIFSLLAIAVMLHPRLSAISPRVKSAAQWAMIVLIALHMIAVDRYVIDIGRETRILDARYGSGVEGNFFTPLTLERDLPWYTLGKAHGARHQDFTGPLRSYGVYIAGNRTSFPVPEALRSVRFADMEPLPGNASARLWHGLVITDHPPLPETPIVITVEPLPAVSLHVSTCRSTKRIAYTNGAGEQLYMLSSEYQGLPDLLDRVVAVDTVP